MIKSPITTVLVFLLAMTCLYGDYVVKGYTSRHIQEAIDIQASRGGGTVLCPAGEYELRSAIYLKDNVQLKGHGKNTILKKCSRFTSPITRNISKGDLYIFIEDESMFCCGDSITIFSQSLKPAKAWVSEIIQILPGQLQMKTAAPFEVVLSSQPFVYCAFPCIYCKEIDNASVDSLLIDGNQQNNPIIDTWWDSGIGCRDSTKISITNVQISGAAGDGISLHGSHHVRIIDSEINRSARLGIHVGSGSQYTYIGNSKILDSGMAGIINEDGLYLCYNAAFGLYENNIITGTRGAGISIGRQDSGNVFLKNRVIKNGLGLLFRDDTFETINIVFLRNQIANNYSWDLYMRKPAHSIFMDIWPKKRFIHPRSSFLYYLDSTQHFWLKFR